MSNPTGKGGFGERKNQINRKGRPKTFDALRALAQQIAHEEATHRDEPVIVNGHKCSVTEVILRQWAQSKDPRLQMHFIEVAFGKVPAVIEGNGPEKEILLRVIYGRPRTDDNPTEPA